MSHPAARLAGIVFLAIAAAGAAPRETYAPVTGALENFILQEMESKGLPALSIALVDGQRVVWARGFGFADPDRRIPAAADTVYRIGSVSKLFTDIGIMQLVERGKLDLDAPITTYIPNFHPPNSFGKPITLRQLMSHRAGLVREPPTGHYFDNTEPTLAATVISLNQEPLTYAPETHIKYSNGGIAVVGYTLERVTRRPFAEYLKKAVLEPMALTSSAFAPEPWLDARLAKAFMWSYDNRIFAAPKFQLGMAPAGSMYSTVTDLGHFLSILFDGGRGPKGRVLKPETVQEMWRPQFAQARPAAISVLDSCWARWTVIERWAIVGRFMVSPPN